MRLLAIFLMLLNTGILTGCLNNISPSNESKINESKINGDRPLDTTVDCKKFTEHELTAAENITMGYVDHGSAGYRRVLGELNSYLWNLIIWRKENPTRSFGVFILFLDVLENSSPDSIKIVFDTYYAEFKKRIAQSDQILAEKIYCLAEKYTKEVQESQVKSHIELAKDLKKSCREKGEEVDKNPIGTVGLPNCLNEYMKVYLTMKSLAQ